MRLVDSANEDRKFVVRYNDSEDFGIRTFSVRCVPTMWDCPLLFEDLNDQESFNSHEVRFISHFLSQVLLGTGGVLSSLLESHIFIGPLRQVPARVLNGFFEDRLSWADGSMAWKELMTPRYVMTKDMEEEIDKEVDQFWSSHHDDLRFLKLSKDSLREGFEIPYKVAWETRGLKLENYQALSHTLNNILSLIGFKYVIDVRAGYKIDSDTLPLDTLKQVVDHPHSRKKIDQFVAQAKQLGVVEEEFELFFFDRSTGVALRPSGLGVGVSQMIPVLLGVIAAETIYSVEQPELHLHPALQCQLADCLIVGRNINKVSLIETHSEHLILRLLRRIRESKLNENKPIRISAEDVSIIYLSEASDGARVTPIRVDEHGQFIDEWPEGFFEEGFNEIAGGL